MPTTMRHVFGVSAYGEHTDGQYVATAPGMQRLTFNGHLLANQVINCKGRRVLTILVRSENDEKTPRKTNIPTHVASGNQSHDCALIAASLNDYFTGWSERLSFPVVGDRRGLSLVGICDMSCDFLLPVYVFRRSNFQHVQSTVHSACVCQSCGFGIC